MTSIKFQSVVEDDIIHIPEQYHGQIDPLVTVTITSPKIKLRTKSKPFTLEDFSAIKIDTRNWKFDREEANER
jgi:hypothetical protein